jgi:hypothetical protein
LVIPITRESSNYKRRLDRQAPACYSISTMNERPSEDEKMIDGIINLEKAALEKLTQDRIASGSLGEEVDDMLSEAGVYWDTLNEEYFSIEAFQRETFERLAEQYASPDHS